MSTTDTPPPRRKLHLLRWMFVLIVATFAWSGWRVVAFRSALKQAEALGWKVKYTDPAETIRKSWKDAFKKETWTDGVTYVTIPTGGEFEQNVSVLHLLNPRGVRINDASTLRDLSSMKPIRRLQSITLHDCKGLTNLDALASLSDLRRVLLTKCAGLTNVDALGNLSALEWVDFSGAGELKNIDALRGHSALKGVGLSGCAALTNVDALQNLSAVYDLYLTGCTGLDNVDVL